MSVMIFCPMEIERKAVARALRASGRRNVRVAQTGIGKDAILRELAHAAQIAPAGTLMVLAGACGGLRPTSAVPGIAAVIDEHGGRWRPRFAADDGVVLVAVDRIIATPADKRSLAEKSGASIVDMETHAFAAECERRGLAWTVVRGVSDTPEETLPSEVLAWVKPDGGTRAMRAAIDLALHPSLIPHVLGVVRRANRVLPKVGERVAQIVEQWERQTPISPLHVPPEASTAIVFGGTFDPPHMGHVELPQRVRQVLEQRNTRPDSAWLVYVPAARSPHKSDPPIAAEADRLELVRLATSGVPRVTVWDDELARADGSDRASYMIDTLARARGWLDAHGASATRLRLLIGADQAAAFHRWREPRRIIELAEPVVMCRGEMAIDAAAVLESLRQTGFWTDAELARWSEWVVPVGRIDASGTAIRQWLAAGDWKAVAAVLPGGVIEYIRARDLYRGDPAASRPI